MKFALHLLLSAAPAVAYLHPSSPTFLAVHHHYRHHQHQPSPRTGGHTSCLYYKEPTPNADGSASADSSGSDNSSNVWSVLANTERWISDTLDRSNKAANARRDAAAAEAEKLKKQKEQEEKSKAMHFADEKGEEQSSSSSLPPPKDNPYVRKEVSYVCETGNELSVVVGGIFRRVREARELGESHGRGVEARLGMYTLCICAARYTEWGVQLGDYCFSFFVHIQMMYVLHPRYDLQFCVHVPYSI